MTDRSVAVELVAKVQGYQARLGTAITATKEFRGELDQMRKNSASNFAQVERSASVAGLALVALAGWATKLAMDFDKQMSEVSAVTNATAGDLDALRQAALGAGKDTIYTATQAAQAEAELAKAGLSTADILGGALTGALSLASAGGLDLAEAADVAAKSMSQFGLKADDVGHVADVLAGVANATATDVGELGFALRMGGGAAHAAGMSFDDTATVLGALTKQALVGSDAGTSLKTMFMMLEAPTVKAQGIMAQYGFSVYDANGNMVDAYEIADRLQKSFGGLTQEQRNAAFANIFGADAQRSANALYLQGASGLRDINKQILAQADAARVAAAKTDNLSGDLERLKGSLETLAISSESGANGGLRFIVQVLDTLLGRFQAMPSVVQSSVVILAGATGASLLAAVAYMKVRNSVNDVMDSMRDAGPVSARFADGLSRTAKFAGRASVALGAVAVAGQLVSAAFGDDTNVQLDTLSKSLLEFGDSGRASGEAARLFGKDMEDLDYDLGVFGSGGLNQAVVAFGSAMEMIGGEGPGSQSIGKAKERIASYDQALTQLVKAGHGAEAAAAFKQFWVEAQKAGISLDDLQAAFPGYVAAAAEAARTTDEQAAAAKAATIKNIKLAGAFGAAASEADGLKNKFDELNGAFLSSVKAEDAAEQAIDDLAGSFKENGKTLDSNTQKGRDNRESLVKVAEASRDAMQAKMDETKSVEESRAVYDHYRKALIDTAMQAGYTREQAEKLADEYMKMPATVNTTVTVTTIKRTVEGDFRAGERMANGGILKAFAAGGEDHSAQIGFPGVMRLWNEPEAGGEAYIPLGSDKRARSRQIWAETGRQLGMAAPAVAMTMMAQPPNITAQVFIGGERIDERVDVRVQAAQRESTAGMYRRELI